MTNSHFVCVLMRFSRFKLYSEENEPSNILHSIASPVRGKESQLQQREKCGTGMLLGT